jgi:hypothetical protein
MPEVRRTFLRRKAVPATCVVSRGSDDESGYDFSTIAVDDMGLPLTYSDQIWYTGVNRDDISLAKQMQDQEEQMIALDSLLKASNAVSKLWFQQKQYRYSSDNHDSDSTDASSIDCVGPSTLAELALLRSAINSLSEAFDQAHPSGHARKIRREYLAKSIYHIPSLKRKSVPDYDLPVEIITPDDINPFLTSPEPQEVLLPTDTSPLSMRAPRLRGYCRARALQKLNDGAIDDSSDDEGGSIAEYYKSSHRAIHTGLDECPKMARRRTSIISRDDDAKNHLLIGAGQHQHVDYGFLYEEHRKAGIMGIVNLDSSSSNSDSSDERQGSEISDYSTTSSQESPSLPSEIDSDYDCSDKSWLGSLSVSTSSSVCELAGDVEKPSATSPVRPKRHPLRPQTSDVDADDITPRPWRLVFER